ncbi:hypothetical protein Efla_000585 [Eimeria flavescens]
MLQNGVGGAQAACCRWLLSERRPLCLLLPASRIPLAPGGGNAAVTRSFFQLTSQRTFIFSREYEFSRKWPPHPSPFSAEAAAAFRCSLLASDRLPLVLWRALSTKAGSCAATPTEADRAALSKPLPEAEPPVEQRADQEQLPAVPLSQRVKDFDVEEMERRAKRLIKTSNFYGVSRQLMACLSGPFPAEKERMACYFQREKEVCILLPHRLQKLLLASLLLGCILTYISYAATDVSSGLIRHLDGLLELLFQLLPVDFPDPEAAHRAAMWLAERGHLPLDLDRDDPALSVTVKGLTFHSPVGLAAGFDKDAAAPLGFCNRRQHRELLSEAAFVLLEHEPCMQDGIRLRGGWVHHPQAASGKREASHLPAGGRQRDHQPLRLQQAGCVLCPSAGVASLVQRSKGSGIGCLPSCLCMGFRAVLLHAVRAFSKGLDVVEPRLKAASEERWHDRLARRCVLGVNLGKNKESQNAEDDIRQGIRRVGRFADYLVINLSSPNTKGLRDLQQREHMKNIIAAAQAELRLLEERDEVTQKERRQQEPAEEEEAAEQKPVDLTLKAKDFFPNQTGKRPLLFVKIAPDLKDEEKRDIAEVALETGLDGLIITNTTIRRPESLKSRNKGEAGGLSGRPLKDLALQCVSDMYKLTNGQVAIIASGGIETGLDAFKRIKAGASVVEIYTSFIYRGPGAARRIKDELLGVLNQAGISNLQDAVGMDHRPPKRKPVRKPTFR